MTHPDPEEEPAETTPLFASGIRRIAYPQPDGTFVVRQWRCHPNGDLIAPIESTGEEEQEENEQ